MLLIYVWFNRIAVYDGSLEVCRHEAAFSNGRIIVADFKVFGQALKAVWREYRNRAVSPVGRLLVRSPAVCMDVREELAGGLSQVEAKVLHDGALFMGARKAEVRYQGVLWTQLA